MAKDAKLDAARRDELLTILEARFAKHANRHAGLDWAAVRKRLEAAPDKLWSLSEMERTGGEPDVIAVDAASGGLVFADCASESPAGRRSLCYDRAALDARKEHKPATSVLDLAAEMGVELLDEAGYARLQELGEFDLKTSSWLLTPPALRKLGGALFGDRRYGRVFTYHNGAESYYGARGFRASLKV
ncbi:MAG: DUF4256 domain-containing protein [Spirochaetales bacterium]|nr:DUF4256 domain-containing protein [Spirochaetales bacterium]